MFPKNYDVATYNPNHDGELSLLVSAVQADGPLAAKYAYCGGETGDVIVYFSMDLTGGEQTNLDAIVTTWGLDDAKRRLYELIDAKASDNIINGVGFEYPVSSGQWLSLTTSGQIKWQGFYLNRTNLTYPLLVRTKDDGTQVSLADAAAVVSAMDAMVTEIESLLTPAQDAKHNVEAAGTIAAAQTAADTYL